MNTPQYSLKHDERLRSLGAVRRLFQDGKSGFVYPLRYMWIASDEPSSSVEVLFSVPKKFHRRANKRNLLRRRVKESYRLSKACLKSRVGDKSIDMALIYTTKEVHSYKTINHAVNKILEQIAQGM